MTRFGIVLLPLGILACQAQPDGLGTGSGARGQDILTTFAAGIAIDQVTINQGTEVVLWTERNGPAFPTVPVVAGRDALVRTFVTLEPDFVPRPLTAEVTFSIEDGSAVSTVTRTVRQSSSAEDLTSTINVQVPGDVLSVDTEFSITLFEALPSEPGGTEHDHVSFDSARDVVGGLPLTLGHRIEVVLLPVVYQADGSGRLPDTSPETVAMMQQWLMSTYPVTEAVVRVGPAFEWAEPLLRDGTGWGDLRDEVSRLRGEANEAPEVYYYGMVSPDVDFVTYCETSCRLGNGVIATNSNIPAQRASVGLGFPSIDYLDPNLEPGVDLGADAPVTIMLHEVGHSLGRQHSFCNDPPGPDPFFPYPDGTLGTWGFDSADQTLRQPDQFGDLMGYCWERAWVSDYTFTRLWQRTDAVGANFRSVETTTTELRVDHEGRVLAQRDVSSGGHRGSGRNSDRDRPARRRRGLDPRSPGMVRRELHGTGRCRGVARAPRGGVARR